MIDLFYKKIRCKVVFFELKNTTFIKRKMEGYDTSVMEGSDTSVIEGYDTSVVVEYDTSVIEGYDTSVVVEYETDEDYRRCLLAAFQLKEYCGSLVDKVDALRVATAGTLLHNRAKKFEFEEDLAFFMLFSFDEFKQTHAMLKLMFV